LSRNLKNLLSHKEPAKDSPFQEETDHFHKEIVKIPATKHCQHAKQERNCIKQATANQDPVQAVLAQLALLQAEHNKVQTANATLQF
jgi:hypothetical protein